MKTSARGLISLLGFVTALAGTLPARTAIVVGTGDPDVDVPAVQNAVDNGGDVFLRGNFSFNRSPTAPAGAIYKRMVTISRNVAISGSRDERGEMPTIEGGEWPFLVDALEAQVTIQGLRFVSPRAGAMWIYSVGGLTISGCRVEGVVPTTEFGLEAGQSFDVATAIFVGADPHPPSQTQLGKPGNFAGTMSILNNDIDLAGPPQALSLGIGVFNVGRLPDSVVNIYVSGNNLRNATEPLINFRMIGGQVYVEWNVLATGSAMGGAANPDALRVVGMGSYLIAHNSIDCGWVDGSATGINVIGQSAPLPESNAIVVDNDINMSAPDGTVFGPNSAGIEIRGFAQGNSVLNNRIRGRARAAISVNVQNGGVPGKTSFIGNILDGFQSSLADVFVDAGATNTVAVGHQSTVEDHGVGTVVVPIPLLF